MRKLLKILSIFWLPGLVLAQSFSTDADLFVFYLGKKNRRDYLRSLQLVVNANNRKSQGLGLISEMIKSPKFELSHILQAINLGAKYKAQDLEGRESPLATAVYQGRKDVVEFLLNQGVLVNEVNPLDGKTALQIASLSHQKDILKYLLKKGADPNLNKSGACTPLMTSAYYGDSESAGELLRYGADPNNTSVDSGLTALHLAADSQMALLLISCGAQIDIKGGINNETPFESHGPLGIEEKTYERKKYKLLLFELSENKDEMSRAQVIELIKEVYSLNEQVANRLYSMVLKRPGLRIFDALLEFQGYDKNLDGYRNFVQSNARHSNYILHAGREWGKEKQGSQSLEPKLVSMRE